MQFASLAIDLQSNQQLDKEIMSLEQQVKRDVLEEILSQEYNLNKSQLNGNQLRLEEQDGQSVQSFVKDKSSCYIRKVDEESTFHIKENLKQTSDQFNFYKEEESLIITDLPDFNLIYSGSQILRTLNEIPVERESQVLNLSNEIPIEREIQVLNPSKEISLEITVLSQQNSIIQPLQEQRTASIKFNELIKQFDNFPLQEIKSQQKQSKQVNSTQQKQVTMQENLNNIFKDPRIQNIFNQNCQSLRQDQIYIEPQILEEQAEVQTVSLIKQQFPKQLVNVVQYLVHGQQVEKYSFSWQKIQAFRLSFTENFDWMGLLRVSTQEFTSQSMLDYRYVSSGIKTTNFLKYKEAGYQIDQEKAFSIVFENRSYDFTVSCQIARNRLVNYISFLSTIQKKTKK